MDADVNATARSIKCLQGIAVGDAIGKQTEGLSREEIRRWYPHGIRGFEGVPGAIIPRYAGNSKREWRMGETTDDTERTLAVARAILRDGEVRHEGVGRELLACVKCVHPGLTSLWEFHQAGDPARIAQRHDGCGAAVRVSPVGMRYRSDRLEEIARGAWEASIPTHGGPFAIAAAAATAGAVSAAVDGASPADILERACATAALAERLGLTTMGRACAETVRAAHDDLTDRPEFDAAVVAVDWFPDDSRRIVPLALALGIVMDSAEAAVVLAANVGGDSDSVASIAAGILGARHPATVREEWVAAVERVNDHDLAGVAASLIVLRR